MKNEYPSHVNGISYTHELSESLPAGTYSVHTHPTYELSYFLRGNATRVIEDRKYRLREGDLVLIRPFRHHFIQIDSTGDYERYNILFDPEQHGIECALLPSEEIEVINLNDNPCARGIFDRLDSYRRLCDDTAFAGLLPHLLSELFYAIRLFPQATAESHPSVSPLISEALRYINENLRSVLDAEEIAAHLFVSKSYLFRLFRQELHRTPKKYIMEKRLYLAQQRIASGEAPTAVFRGCGFRDYTTFYRNYTAFFGHSPAKKE